MKTVKIVSDGTSMGTHVTTEDGSEIGSVSSISWHLDAHDGIARAELVTLLPQVEVTAEARLTGFCRYCGHVEEVEP